MGDNALQKAVSQFVDLFNKVPNKPKKSKGGAVLSGPPPISSQALAAGQADTGNIFGGAIPQGPFSTPDGVMPTVPKPFQLSAGTSTAGAKDPVIAAMERALASMPGAPARGAYLAPYDQAAGRAQGAYDAAIPAIADAYTQLKAKLATGQQGATAEASQATAQRQAQLAAALAQIQGYQAQTQQDLATQGGTAALGSLSAAAQAQAGANNAGLALQGSQEQQAAAQRQASMDAQFADRQSAADTGAQVSQLDARTALDQALNGIGLQRSNAEVEYMNLVNRQAAQRSQAEIELAKAESQDTPQSRRATEIDLAMKELGLKSAQKKFDQGDTDGRGLPDPNDYGPVAQMDAAKGGTAFKALNEVIAAAGSKADRIKGEATLNKFLADAAKADQQNGTRNYQPEIDSIVIDGKRISIGWLRTWLDQFYS